MEDDQRHNSTNWIRSEEAEMLHLSSLGLLPDPNMNLHDNFEYRMKSEGPASMGNKGITVTYGIKSRGPR